MARKWDDCYDFVIVGSGAASIPAALVVQKTGNRVLIVEKADVVGGSTAISGGVLWIPNNPVQKRAGVSDTYELAKTYLDACAGPYAPGSTSERRQAFLTEGPKLVSFLEAAGMKFVHAEGWSDYHEAELPGAIARSRSITAEMFDMNKLQKWKNTLRRLPRPPVRSTEPGKLGLYGRSWPSRFAMLRVGLRMTLNALGRDFVGLGGALQGRLLDIALSRGIPIWPNTPARELVLENDRIVGVIVQKDGKDFSIEARGGVLVDAGGFAQNATMRQQYQQAPIGSDWTNAVASDTGEMIEHLISLGADTYLMDQSWWVPVSLMPGGARAGNVAELSKPNCIVVDASGERFVNESTSYVAFGMAMYERNKTAMAVPSWAILDSRHRERYMWAGIKPGKVPPEWISSGYWKTAHTIEELARICGINASTLCRTVDRFNGFARTGIDEDFGRGRSAFHRYYGDPTVKPNSNLGAIEEPPFYAVAIYPGDVGTCGGVVTDEFARVLRSNGNPISGLYAAGNCTATVMGRSYPGAGASIAPAAVFGFIAARHAMAAND